MEYRVIWLTFFIVLSLLGSAVAILPRMVIWVLRQARTAPDRRYILLFRVVGVVVAAVSVAEIISIIKWEHLL